MRKTVTALLAVMLFGVVSLGSVGTAAGATRQSAAPAAGPWFGDCWHFVDYQARRISGYCDGGGGAQFYVFIECKSPIWPWPYTNFGELEYAGGGMLSITSCNNPVVDAGLVKVPDI